MCRLINLFKINFDISEIYSVHPTSNINTYHIRHCFIFDRHCSSNRAAFSGVNIRHNTNFRLFRYHIITHSTNLLNCFRLYHFRIADCRIHFSFYFKSTHFLFPSLMMSRSKVPDFDALISKNRLSSASTQDKRF